MLHTPVTHSLVDFISNILNPSFQFTSNKLLHTPVTHSLVDSRMLNRVYKVSGHCSICIWKVHVWHLSICALSMTLKNSDLLSTAHFSSNVTAIGLFAAMPHGLLPWKQPSCFCHLEVAIFGGSHIASMGSNLASALHFKQQIEALI